MMPSHHLPRQARLPVFARLRPLLHGTVTSEIGFRFSFTHLSGARTVYAFNQPHRVSSHACVPAVMQQRSITMTVSQPGLSSDWTISQKWLRQEVAVITMTVVKISRIRLHCNSND